MPRILLLLLFAFGSLIFSASSARACHPLGPVPPPLDPTGCPHCVRVGGQCVVPLPVDDGTG